MTDKKFEFWTSTKTTVEDEASLLTSLFYQAEADAFECDVLRKKFADVGLWPWNPDKILQNCQENCPVEAGLNESQLVRKLLMIIKSIDEEKERRIQRMLDELKEEQVVSEKEVLEKTASERNLTIKLFGDWKKVRSQRIRKAKKTRIKKHAGCSCLPKRGRGRPRKNSEEKK